MGELWQKTPEGIKCNPEELGDLLADISNRLSCVENSQPYSRETEVELPIKQPPVAIQWRKFQQLEGLMLYLQNKQNEIIDALGLKRDDNGKLGRSISKRKSTNKDIYIYSTIKEDSDSLSKREVK